MQCRSHSRRRTSECLFVTACSIDEYAKKKRTEKNLIVRSGRPISEAETTIIGLKDCARRFVLKRCRHEASRGLLATAELVYLNRWLYASVPIHSTTLAYIHRLSFPPALSACIPPKHLNSSAPDTTKLAPRPDAAPWRI